MRCIHDRTLERQQPACDCSTLESLRLHRQPRSAPFAPVRREAGGQALPPNVAGAAAADDVRRRAHHCTNTSMRGGFTCADRRSRLQPNCAPCPTLFDSAWSATRRSTPPSMPSHAARSSKTGSRRYGRQNPHVAGRRHERCWRDVQVCPGGVTHRPSA